MKKVILGIIVLGILGAGFGYYMFNKPLEGVHSMKSNYSTSASDLLADFETDENQANQKYLDKVIEVKGTVSKLENNEGTLTIYLDANSGMSNVIFQLEDPETKIKVGENITLKGICTGYLMDVVLVRAVKL